jgi:hypothetical protein
MRSILADDFSDAPIGKPRDWPMRTEASRLPDPTGWL